MLTLKTETRILTRLNSLTELELGALLDEWRPHLEKNGLLHVLESSDLKSLNRRIEELEEELHDMEGERDDLKEKCDDAADELDDIDLEAGIPKQEETIIGAVTVAKVKRKGSKVEDEYPAVMEIEMLAAELNLPTLQSSVDDIEQNYLKRNASRKYILWDFPEKEIEKMKAELKLQPYRLQIPPALRSILPDETASQILEFWKTTHELNLTLEEYNKLHPPTVN